MTKHVLVGAICAACASIAFAADAAPVFTPTSTYTQHNVLDHTILVNPEVEKHPRQLEAAFEELTSQLRKIHRVVPAEHLKRLQEVRIWVEWQAKPRGAAEFHQSRDWLKKNGYNPEKVNGVEINNAINFVKWSRQNQPWMLMHELAHAYQKMVIGNGYKPVRAAYKRAMGAKLYHAVANSRGKKVKAYCTNNHLEFFAEMTEAYLGRNDYYPRTRNELKQYDPKTYAVIEKIWKASARP